MNIDDYESLPTTSVAINMTAGGIAGVLEHCIMYPLDSVKTRMQSLSPSTARYDITTTFQTMIKKEGLMRPIRGVTAVVAGAGPAHALYFGFYELSKELLTKITSNNALNYTVAGVVATLIHDAVSNPTEVIKQRMQMYNSQYKSVIACMKGVYKTEGLKAFYRSYSTQLVMNIPYQTIHFGTYEFFQNLLNNERKYNPGVHVVAGGAAGAAAAAVTTPLDVIKTVLNTQETGITRGIADAAKTVYTMAGPLGFFKGITARVLYSMPATAICWSTYEFFKFYLTGMDREQYKSSITGKTQLQPRESTATLIPGSIVAEAQKQTTDTSAYVLPLTTTTTSSEKDETSQSDSRQHPPTAPGTIKSVCDLSSTITTTPTLNLNTRHTDVKSPFDRRFSS